MKHDAVREGIKLGLVMATSIWIWIAVVDALTGQPFRTFTVLGGILQFTVLHYVLNLAYGVAVVAGVHSAVQEPSLIGVLAFLFVVVEFALVLVTVLLSNLGLGHLAWVRILGGSLIGAVIALMIVARGHPLLATWRQAETENENV